MAVPEKTRCKFPPKCFQDGFKSNHSNHFKAHLVIESHICKFYSPQK